MRTVSAEEAYHQVSADVGATLSKRDPVDERIIREVITGKPTYGNGVVLHPSDVGGYPELTSGSYKAALITAAFKLSQTIFLGTPPKNSNHPVIMSTCSSRLYILPAQNWLVRPSCEIV